MQQDAGGPDHRCGEKLQRGSVYCAEHHALTHVAPGSAGEARQLRELEALATVVGGKRGLDAAVPPRGLMRRLLGVERRFSRS